jgi:hypothetical protein
MYVITPVSHTSGPPTVSTSGVPSIAAKTIANPARVDDPMRRAVQIAAAHHNAIITPGTNFAVTGPIDSGIAFAT